MPPKKQVAGAPSPRVDENRHLHKLDQPQAHEYIAEQLRRHIALRLVLPGEALPPDRELAQIFGAGRATVQLALGNLAEEGLIETRRGRRGGTFVRALGDDDETAAQLLNDLLRNRHEIEDALELRRVLEPAACGLAATRHTPDNVAAMWSACEEMQNAPSEQAYMRHDTDLHLTIARTTRNDLMYDALERVRLILNGPLEALPESDVWHDRLQAEHELIVSAIERGEPDTATALMLAHVQVAERALRAVLTQLARSDGDGVPAS